MVLPEAIVDTSVLIAMHHLGVWNCLNLLYTKVYVPRAVEREFLARKDMDEPMLSKHHKFLEHIYSLPWVEACSDYDSVIVGMYNMEKGIHLGESEAFAQWQALGNIPEVLVDDRKARSLARIEKIEHHGTMYLLALLEIRLKCIRYYQAAEKLRKELKFRINDKTVEEVYRNVKNRLL